MRDWLLGEMEQSVNPERTETRNQQIIDSCEGPIPTDKQIPPWQWDDTKPFPRLEPVPPSEGWPPKPPLADSMEVPDRATPGHTPGAADRIAKDAGLNTGVDIWEEGKKKGRVLLRKTKNKLSRVKSKQLEGKKRPNSAPQLPPADSKTDDEL